MRGTIIGEARKHSSLGCMGIHQFLKESCMGICTHLSRQCRGSHSQSSSRCLLIKRRKTVPAIPQTPPTDSNRKRRLKMAVSFSFSGERQPARSISLPSRLDNHNSIRIQTVLERMNFFRPTSSYSTSGPLCGEEIQAGLVKLAELYNCVEDLVQSPLTKRDLLHYQDGKLVQESLHGSLVLLDSCGCARDAMVAMRDHIQTLQSALRRKGAHSSTETLIRTYILCRKRVKKEVAKCIQQLKKMEAKILFPLPDSDHNLWLLLQPLREASIIAISVLKSLMMFLSMPVVHNKLSKWDLISQLRSKSVKAAKGSEVENEVVSVDLSLSSIPMGCRESMEDQVRIAQRMLGRLSICLHSLEGELETVFRCLLRHRVSFLNILAH